MDKQSKNSRILDLYVRLSEGKTISKEAEAQRFGVDKRSIQRDIDMIRTFLSEHRALNTSDTCEIIYDRGKKGFVMSGSEASAMSNSEILAVTKILLESRAFTRKELNDILDKVVEGCVPLKNMKLVSDLIANEKYHYVELHHKSAIKDKLWELGGNIKEHNILEIKYSKADTPKEFVRRAIEPVALLFSEYYFYLNAYIVEKNKDGKYTHKYDYPAIFRIDRIKEYRETGEKFQITYADRFEEGEFRKRIQFMYAGQLMKIQLKFYGSNPEPILDRLPTAQVIEQKEHECTISAEVYGKGIMMWLLSQGSKVEVMRPESLRQDMKRELEAIAALYQ